MGRLIGGDSLLTRSLTVSEGGGTSASGDRSDQSRRPEGLSGALLIIGADDQKSHTDSSTVTSCLLSRYTRTHNRHIDTRVALLNNFQIICQINVHLVGSRV